MSYPNADATDEQRDKAAKVAGKYLRATRSAANTGNYPGAELLKRTKAPSDDDLHRLEASLRKRTRASVADAETYTKGYTRQLTPQQQTFLDQLIKGDTLIHSYEVAYPNDTSSTKTKHSSAYRLSQHPVVIAAMDKAALTLRNKVQMNASAIREYVIERLLHESQNAFTDGTRVRALELLGKVAEVGMFVTRTETTNITVPPSELQATLLAKLKEFFDRANNPALPLAVNTDRRQTLTIEAETEDVTEVAQSVTATVRQSPISTEGSKGDDAPPTPLVPATPKPQP